MESRFEIKTSERHLVQQTASEVAGGDYVQASSGAWHSLLPISFGIIIIIIIIIMTIVTTIMSINNNNNNNNNNNSRNEMDDDILPTTHLQTSPQELRGLTLIYPHQ